MPSNGEREVLHAHWDCLVFEGEGRAALNGQDPGFRLHGKNEDFLTGQGHYKVYIEIMQAKYLADSGRNPKPS